MVEVKVDQNISDALGLKYHFNAPAVSVLLVDGQPIDLRDYAYGAFEDDRKLNVLAGRIKATGISIINEQHSVSAFTDDYLTEVR